MLAQLPFSLGHPGRQRVVAEGDIGLVEYKQTCRRAGLFGIPIAE